MNTSKTRYFAFDTRYKNGDDYVRCNPIRSVIVAPSVGETDASEELSLDRCIDLVRRGILTEVSPSLIGERKRAALH